jgi:hypothetical protein
VTPLPFRSEYTPVPFTALTFLSYGLGLLLLDLYPKVNSFEMDSWPNGIQKVGVDLRDDE